MKRKKINKILEKYSLRKTPGMKKILSIFIDTKKPITAEDIYSNLKKSVNQSTVYRTINRFIEKNIIQEVYLSSEKKYYELTNRHHHHHLICTSCEKIVDIPCMSEIVRKIQPKNYNFESIENHSFELFGTCNKCK